MKSLLDVNLLITYLLALAVEHGCQFVTLDQSIPVSAVTGATAQNLVVL